ncbi:hypothetical protein [uncultured Deinococcus sp.]|uniref:hypothetical protein n=1 Tax=uncultured Deinococcus sp. TaxID=158789 RepID=UPI0025D26482|nr:hypothetical protein [uncultured Deinococcus sp.]
MRALKMVWLIGFLGACAPTMTTPESRVVPQTAFSGRLLSVILTNAGPHPLLLENTCPRPFEVVVAGSGSGIGAAASAQQLETCSTLKFPPQPWPVGGTVMAAVILNLPSGEHTLSPTAVVRVKVAPTGKAAGEYRTLRVAAPAITFNVP